MKINIYANINIIPILLYRITIQQIKITNCMNIIANIMEIIEKITVTSQEKSIIVINTLRNIIDVNASRKDFIIFISEKIMNDIQILLNADLIQPSIDIICDACNGKFNINQDISTNCITSCINAFNKNKDPLELKKNSIPKSISKNVFPISFILK